MKNSAYGISFRSSYLRKRKRTVYKSQLPSTVKKHPSNGRFLRDRCDTSGSGWCLFIGLSVWRPVLTRTANIMHSPHFGASLSLHFHECIRRIIFPQSVVWIRLLHSGDTENQLRVPLHREGEQSYSRYEEVGSPTPTCCRRSTGPVHTDKQRGPIPNLAA